MMEPVVSWLLTTATQLLTGARARWSGCGPAPAQRIYFANHTSHLDFVLLWSALPASMRRRTRPVAAADYWNRTAWRRYLIHRVFRGVLIDRQPTVRCRDPLAPLLDVLDKGESLILFPEGTRGEGEELLPFKPGLYHLAKLRPNVDLVPVYMDNCYRVMPKGSALPVPLLCSVTFGEPTHRAAEEPKSEFLDRLRQSVRELGTA